jgi:RHS repeat-associated protein
MRLFSGLVFQDKNCSSRIGIETTHAEMIGAISVDPDEMQRILGHKQYEISKHLGNVLVVVSDQKRADFNGSNITSYSTVILSATDYSPFGVGLYGRTYSGEGYRYGFNGKELDNKCMGGGGQTYDYGFRIYNPALGRFLSTDPLFRAYPWYTPYQFAGNKPIIAIDVDGLEELDYNLFLEGLVTGYKLLIEIPFPRIIPENDPYGRTTTDGWYINPDNQFWSLEGSTYSMKKGISPSDALQDMLDHPDNYTVDCAQFVDLERLVGMRNSMGDEEFDKYIKKQGHGKFEIKQHGSTGVNAYDTDVRGINGKFRSVGGGIFKAAREKIYYGKLPVGSRLWIGSVGYEKSAYQGENLIKVGKNRYNAQGIGENMTLRQIKKALAKKQTPIDGEKQKISVELLQTYKGSLNNEK